MIPLTLFRLAARALMGAARSSRGLSAVSRFKARKAAGKAAGKSPSMEIRVEVDKRSLDDMRDLQKKYPKLFWRAFAWGAADALRQLKKSVRVGGGVNGVPSFAPKLAFTKKLEKIEGRKKNWYGKIGAGKVINRWKQGQDQHVGWISNVASWAAAVETKAHKDFSEKQWGWFRYHGFLREEIPDFYDRPARDVITPFAEFQKAGEFRKNVVGALNRLLAKGTSGRRSR